MKKIIKLNINHSNSIEQAYLSKGFLSTEKIQSYTENNPYFLICNHKYAIFHNEKRRKLTGKIKQHPLVEYLAQRGNFGVKLCIVPLKYAYQNFKLSEVALFEIEFYSERNSHSYLIYAIGNPINNFSRSSLYLKQLISTSDKKTVLLMLIKAGKTAIELYIDRKYNISRISRQENKGVFGLIDSNYIDTTIGLSDETLAELNDGVLPYARWITGKSGKYS